MKKLLATLPLLTLLSCTGIPPQHALSHFDWTEPADPQGEKPETWNGVEKPIVTFGSTDVRYPRATPCAAAVTDQTTLTGWRGEKVSAQAVISAPAAVGGLTCTVGDFVADNGAKLPGNPAAHGRRTTRRTSKRTCSTRRLHATCPPGRPVPSGSR